MSPGAAGPMIVVVAEPRLYRIEDDLAEGSFDDWLAGVVGDVETYLSRHAAFAAFLDDED